MESIYRKNGQGWQDLDDDELKSLLFKCLKDKSYLVVMDDIWEIEAWNEVSVAFPTNSNGSRVLITSRIKEVALVVLIIVFLIFSLMNSHFSMKIKVGSSSLRKCLGEVHVL